MILHFSIDFFAAWEEMKEIRLFLHQIGNLFELSISYNPSFHCSIPIFTDLPLE